MSGAVSYRLCEQCVTVYHRTDDGEVERRVYPKAYLEHVTTRSTHRTAGRTVSKIGMSEEMSALLVIPWQSEPCPVQPGDKVIRGDGPEVTAAEWARFTPALVPGLVVLRYVTLRYWHGAPCHLEAGG